MNQGSPRRTEATLHLIPDLIFYAHVQYHPVESTGTHLSPQDENSNSRSDIQVYLTNTIGITVSLLLDKLVVMTSESASDHSKVVDAREIDGEPFDVIMTALDGLEPGNTLLLVNSFEPEPLYNVLTEQGFDYETTQVSDAEWHVEITHA